MNKIDSDIKKTLNILIKVKEERNFGRHINKNVKESEDIMENMKRGFHHNILKVKEEHLKC